MIGSTSDQGVVRELSIGEAVSKTFELYRQDFTKYLTVFLIVEGVLGVLSALVNYYVHIPTLVTNPTPQDFAAWFPGFFLALGEVILLSFVVALVLGPISIGSAIVMASDRVKGGQADLGRGVRLAVSKLVWLWALGFIVGVLVVLGLIALVVPGIILAIMFSLSLPVLLLEGKGVMDSMSRSRALVGGRWAKSFVLFLVLAVIAAVAGIIAGVIAGPFGALSPVVSGLLSAFYAPLLPILLTVYYYSNVARWSPLQPAVALSPADGFKFCPTCGTRLGSMAQFCSKCGAKQPT